VWKVTTWHREVINSKTSTCFSWNHIGVRLEDEEPLLLEPRLLRLVRLLHIQGERARSEGNKWLRAGFRKQVSIRFSTELDGGVENWFVHWKIQCKELQNVLSLRRQNGGVENRWSSNLSLLNPLLAYGALSPCHKLSKTALKGTGTEIMLI